MRRGFPVIRNLICTICPSPEAILRQAVSSTLDGPLYTDSIAQHLHRFSGPTSNKFTPLRVWLSRHSSMVILTSRFFLWRNDHNIIVRVVTISLKARSLITENKQISLTSFTRPDGQARTYLLDFSKRWSPTTLLETESGNSTRVTRPNASRMSWTFSFFYRNWTDTLS